MIEPRIERLKTKYLVGHCLAMSVVQNKTAELWGGLAPHIKKIKNRVSEDKISLQVYPSGYHQQFDPQRTFVKWATVEVNNFEHVLEGLQSFELTGGLYAVFDYKGSSRDTTIFHYIFSEWLPNSNYWLDDRPHFEVLGVNYRNNDPNSEEEIWIPIKDKDGIQEK